MSSRAELVVFPNVFETTTVYRPASVTNSVLTSSENEYSASSLDVTNFVLSILNGLSSLSHSTLTGKSDFCTRILYGAVSATFEMTSSSWFNNTGLTTTTKIMNYGLLEIDGYSLHLTVSKDLFEDIFPASLVNSAE